MIENDSKIQMESKLGLLKLAQEFDIETAKELALAFLEDTEPVIKRIEKAISEKNQEELRCQSHLLKGCSRILNATSLEETANGLELSSKDHDWQSIDEQFQILKPIYNSVKESILEYTNTES